MTLQWINYQRAFFSADHTRSMKIERKLLNPDIDILNRPSIGTATLRNAWHFLLPYSRNIFRSSECYIFVRKITVTASTSSFVKVQQQLRSAGPTKVYGKHFSSPAGIRLSGQREFDRFTLLRVHFCGLLLRVLVYIRAIPTLHSFYVIYTVRTR